MWDEKLRCGGMNHFMLPVSHKVEATFFSDAGRYGINAMELLINAMLSQGARRDRFVAKVFGGGHVLRGMSYRNPVPDANAEFALSYLEAEGIPVIAHDVGGNRPRDVRFLLQTGKVLVRKIANEVVTAVAREEKSYRNSLDQGPSSVVFFDESGTAPKSKRRKS